MSGYGLKVRVRNQSSLDLQRSINIGVLIIIISIGRTSPWNEVSIISSEGKHQGKMGKEMKIGWLCFIYCSWPRWLLAFRLGGHRIDGWMGYRAPLADGSMVAGLGVWELVIPELYCIAWH